MVFDFNFGFRKSLESDSTVVYSTAIDSNTTDTTDIDGTQIGMVDFRIVRFSTIDRQSKMLGNLH